ncbi:hypothetical protein GPECTOR_78g57 [Gonium pectorale]|uniref:Uncharacterized protein n=1 Tax=Gonium pectorale TaxID=33097 RepID=A0A150G1W8_GONPE|nr:hypothetical protein GPECTOR_78g57 [Gonium pectorale]|eukprot:KXZ43869.1 hypothetical protein GPECTOR_78g57 [Gonium pectorale]
MLRNRSARRDGRVHSSPTVRLAALDAEQGGGADGSSGMGVGGLRGHLAPILEPRLSHETTPPGTGSARGCEGLLPTAQTALQAPASSDDAPPGGISVTRHAGSAGNSAAQWPSTGVSASGAMSSSLLVGGLSPGASRSHSLSQAPPHRRLSRANMLVRQLTGSLGKGGMGRASSGSASALGPGAAGSAGDGDVSNAAGGGGANRRTGGLNSYMTVATGIGDGDPEGDSGVVELSAIGMVREGVLRTMNIGGTQSPQVQSTMLKPSLGDPQSLDLGGAAAIAVDDVTASILQAPARAGLGRCTKPLRRSQSQTLQGGGVVQGPQS